MSIGKFTIGENGIGDAGGIVVAVPTIAIVLTNAVPSLGIYIPSPSVGMTITLNSPSIFVFVDTPASNIIGEDSIATGTIGEGGILGSATTVLNNYIAQTINFNAPIIYAGKAILPGSIGLNSTFNIPRILHSATINVDNTSYSFALNTPKLEHVINLGKIDYSFLSEPPSIYTGKQELISTVEVSFTPVVPNIYSGSLISIPYDIQANFICYTPQIKTGLVVRAWTVTTIQFPRGSIGDHTIAGHAIDETWLEDQTVEYTNIFVMSLNSPTIYAGKTILPNSWNYTFIPKSPEISARGRRVKAQFIAY